MNACSIARATPNEYFRPPPPPPLNTVLQMMLRKTIAILRLKGRSEDEIEAGLGGAGGGGLDRRNVLDIMHGRSRMTIDRRKERT